MSEQHNGTENKKVEDPADYKGGDSMGYNYEVGDIVTLKKPHPCGSKEWEISACRCGFPIEMHGMRTSDYDSDENWLKKIQKI